MFKVIVVEFDDTSNAEWPYDTREASFSTREQAELAYNSIVIARRCNLITMLVESVKLVEGPNESFIKSEIFVQQ